MAIFDDFLRKRKENYYSFSDRKRLKELIDKLSDGSFDFSTKFVEKLSKYESVDASTIKREFENVQDLARIDYGLLVIFSQFRSKYRLEFKSKRFKKEFKEIYAILKRLKNLLEKEKEDINKLLAKGDKKGRLYGGTISKTLLMDLSEVIRKERSFTERLSKYTYKIIDDAKPDISAKKGNLYVEINMKSGRTKTDEINSGIYIYDNNMLVARGGTLVKKGPIVHSFGLDTLVPFAGYLRKAILLLLRDKKIVEWVSSRARTALGDRLFESISKEKDIVAFIGEDRLWHVRLA